MTNLQYTLLENRGLLHISGDDASEFLQGMISNDIELVTPEKSVYAALLTPQGKFLFDFFVLRDRAGTGYLLDCDRERLPALQKRLSMYKLRADVTLDDASERILIVSCFGADTDSAENGSDQVAGSTSSYGEGILYVDPRLAEMGVRIILPLEGAVETLEASGFVRADTDAWDHHRLANGVPDAGRDVLIEKSMPLECNFGELGAISYTKGCYVGQELTARTHHRGTLRKRLLPVRITGDVPASGTPIMHNDREVGIMRSGLGENGMALIRLEHLSSTDAAVQPVDVFDVDGASVQPWIPRWVEIKPLAGE
ncbi:MAG: folate-binding protein YgfZ [Alphaproteobacteria bacterium]|jgi:folate-binding protein YgfZ|nr:folate-binding protein YgfZ [Alphaproteobacteria bacterium]MBT4086096.1 folate-binding protein YgfZ [Alphaproteobacteria bacterium]MBT4543713.1 folate-binding protein YgfZ [Alphaproteobacteria bacterium]MBT7743958.1 folate-binding protein YgfZ [Alphaproteobacteria bacterium]